MLPLPAAKSPFLDEVASQRTRRLGGREEDDSANEVATRARHGWRAAHLDSAPIPVETHAIGSLKTRG